MGNFYVCASYGVFWNFINRIDCVCDHCDCFESIEEEEEYHSLVTMLIKFRNVSYNTQTEKFLRNYCFFCGIVIAKYMFGKKLIHVY